LQFGSLKFQTGLNGSDLNERTLKNLWTCLNLELSIFPAKMIILNGRKSSVTVMANYQLNINGQRHEVEADPDTPILWVLRDNLNLVGTKYGCGIAQCGSCTIHLDGEAAKSCSLPVSAVLDRKITTIEGLSKKGDHPLQEAWRQHDVPQCGYCQAGQIMTAAAFLKKNKRPDDVAIEQAMDGNLCRCGTYNRIKAAIKTASTKM
jgi:aerobic-type carbon monoxide dehydrogenase small subunit (CoxS/CutS family)